MKNLLYKGNQNPCRSRVEGTGYLHLTVLPLHQTYIFATDAQVGVHPAKHLTFAIILSPVGAYYPQGIAPVKIFVEQKYVRAVIGGTGFTKAGANYAISLKGVRKRPLNKVMFKLYGLTVLKRKYVEEVGSMNVFFKN